MKLHEKVYIPVRVSERLPSIPDENYFVTYGEIGTEEVLYWDGDDFDAVEYGNNPVPEEWLGPTRDVIVLTPVELRDLLTAVGVPDVKISAFLKLYRIII